jgi:hypothetical protein
MPRRVRAALLAVLFLAGSFGVSIADALLFHQAGSDPFAGVVHIEGVDTGHHAERCLLSQATPAPREALDLPVVVAAAPPVVQIPVLAPAYLPATTFLAADHLSRAPPA